MSGLALQMCGGASGGNMASPMQDTDVSSTVTSLYSPSYTPENNLQCDVVVQELTSDECMKLEDCSKLNNNISSSLQSNEDCCSWSSDFSKAICQLAASTNHELLKPLLIIYAKNITKDAFTWNTKLSKLAVLRKQIKNVLLYYHFHWYENKEKSNDHYFYLQNMSDILVTYVNLELIFFKNSIDPYDYKSSLSKTTNMLINILFIYLGNSEEHIFKVLLQSNLATKENNKICSQIFDKCFSNIMANKPHITSIMYTRYILALKLWKSVCDGQEEMRKINNIAFKIMGYMMPSICFDTLHFLPKPPKKCVTKTLWFLQTSSFDLTKTVEKFLKFEEDTHYVSTESEFNVIMRSKNCCHLQINENLLLKSNNNKKRIKLQDYLSRKKKKSKSDEIIFIDLTKEDNHKFDQKNVKVKQNLKWLKNVKKNFLKRLNYIHKESYTFDNVCSNLESDSSGIFENSDPTKDKNQNSETSKFCSVSSDVIDDYWKQKILQTNSPNKNGKKSMFVQEKVGDKEELRDFESFSPPEEKKRKQHRRKRSAASLKINEPPIQKTKITELFTLSDDDDSVVWLNQGNKLGDIVESTWNESDEESNNKLISNLQNQELYNFIKITNLENLAKCIKGSKNNKMVVIVDPNRFKGEKFEEIRPSMCQYFISLLYEKRLLLRQYIESDEDIVKNTNIPSEKIITVPRKDSILLESLCSQVKCDFSEANIIIFFTNLLSSIFKWLISNHPRMFIIQENANEKDKIKKDTLNEVLNFPKDFQFNSNTKIEKIPVDNYSLGCQILVAELGWKKVEKLRNNVSR